MRSTLRGPARSSGGRRISASTRACATRFRGISTIRRGARPWLPPPPREVIVEAARPPEPLTWTIEPVPREKTTTFGIIGLGYVGLPLAVEAAKSGLRAIGFDINERVVKGVNEGTSHIQDVAANDVGKLRKKGLLEATIDMKRLSECDVVSICVPTPLSKTRDPDVSFIIAASDSVAAALRKGQLVILESTTYPGTTREILLPALEATGLKVGKDFNLCFSPERVDPGNPVWNTKNTPKVVGGITDKCTEAGAQFYRRFLETIIPV